MIDISSGVIAMEQLQAEFSAVFMIQLLCAVEGTVRGILYVPVGSDGSEAGTVDRGVASNVVVMVANTVVWLDL